MCSAQCAVYSVQCTVCSVKSSMCIVQSIVYSVECAVFSMQCTVYSVWCTVSVDCFVTKVFWRIWFTLIYTQDLGDAPLKPNKRKVLCSVVLWRTCSVVQCSTVQMIAEQNSSLKWSAVHWSGLQCIALHCIAQQFRWDRLSSQQPLVGIKLVWNNLFQQFRKFAYVQM